MSQDAPKLRPRWASVGPPKMAQDSLRWEKRGGARVAQAWRQGRRKGPNPQCNNIHQRSYTRAFPRASAHGEERWNWSEVETIKVDTIPQYYQFYQNLKVDKVAS